jgi:hypothetical protein
MLPRGTDPAKVYRSMRRLAHTLLATLAVPLLGSGCEDAEGDLVAKFRAALPTPDELTLRVPEAPLDDPETARMVAFAAATADQLNAGLGKILAPILDLAASRKARVVDQRKVVFEGSRAAIGVDWLCVVEKAEVGYFSFLLFVRETDSGDPWALLISGTQTRGAHQKAAQGSVWVDLDQHPAGEGSGKRLALWKREDGELALSVYEYAFAPAGEPPRNRQFRFQIGALGGGSFDFEAPDFEVYPRHDDSLPESGRIHVAWLPTGAGRGDLAASGGDLEADGFEAMFLSQCWSETSFAPSYVLQERVPTDPAARPQIVEAGDPNTCVFEERRFPFLPEAPPEPVPPEPLPIEAR